MSEAPESVALDYFTLARDEPDGQVRVVTVSVRKDLVAAYRTLCQAAGLKLAGITPRAMGTLAALDRAIDAGAVTAPEGRRTSFAALTRGEKWGELIIARDGQVVFARTMSATALNSEPMLLGELRRNLAVYNGQNPQQPVEALYVAEAAGPGGWSGRIRAGLQIPVQSFDPLAGVENTTPPDARGHFAALAGLLTLKARARAAADRPGRPAGAGRPADGRPSQAGRVGRPGRPGGPRRARVRVRPADEQAGRVRPAGQGEGRAGQGPEDAGGGRQADQGAEGVGRDAGQLAGGVLRHDGPVPGHQQRPAGAVPGRAAGRPEGCQNRSTWPGCT